MAASGSAKVCVVCGEDCANRQRTKDNKGRYYCQPCYEKARHDVQKKVAAPLKIPKAPARPIPDSTFNPFDEMLESTQRTSGRTCGSCGNPIAEDAIICLGCGFNIETGSKLGVKVEKPKRERSINIGGSLSGLLSPPVAGLLALGFFVGFFFLAQGDEGLSAAYIGIHSVFALVVWVFVIIAGFRESILYGIGCLICLPVSLYVAFAVNDNGYIKWLYGVSFIAGILEFCLPGFLDSRLAHQFGH